MFGTTNGTARRQRGEEEHRTPRPGTPLDDLEFAALMAPLGPFAARPGLAVAVSGGADSMALAWLTGGWARARGGALLALVVDHGLRPASAAEAAVTVERLAGMGIAARCLTLSGLAPGSGLAARARAARHAALAEAAAAAGLCDLLLGHHAADQAETLMMRALGGSGDRGLAGMAAQRETAGVRLLRPLLGTMPARLRATLRAAGIGWVEDPSNADRHALRVRLRGSAGADSSLVEAAASAGAWRADGDRGLAGRLAERMTIFPEGYALLEAGAVPPQVLAALLRTIAGRAFTPSARRLAALAAAPRPATLGGARLLHWRTGLLVVREAAAQAPPMAARSGAVWDGRFRLAADLPGSTFGALGTDARSFRRLSPLPAVVLATLPAIRCNGIVTAVPHLGYSGDGHGRMPCLWFRPAEPVCGAPFLPTTQASGAMRDA